MSVLFGGSLSVAAPGGGGGAPLGAATIWPFVADWAALSTVAGPLRDGDQVFVSDLGSPASYGLAQYDEGDAEWKLLFGWFVSFADMTAFAEPNTWVTPPSSVPPAAEARKERRLMVQRQPWTRRVTSVT